MIAALILAAACSGDCKAQQTFVAMERRLLEKPVQVEVKSHADGAVKADATSRLFIGPATRIHAEGTFQGKPFTRNFDQPTTQGLRDAILVGMARMGVLHNVAVMVSGGPPEHADGTVREWLEPHDFRPMKGGVAYRLRVGGHDTSEVRLTLAKGLPKRRTMTVHFPNGDMRVIEDYRFPPIR